MSSGRERGALATWRMRFALNLDREVAVGKPNPGKTIIVYGGKYRAKEEKEKRVLVRVTAEERQAWVENFAGPARRLHEELEEAKRRLYLEGKFVRVLAFVRLLSSLSNQELEEVSLAGEVV